MANFEVTVANTTIAVAVGENTAAAAASASAAATSETNAATSRTRAANAVPFDTWTELAAATSMVAGDRATVLSSDTGTHTDPVVGGTVANAGVFEYSASPAGWERIADAADSGAVQDQIDALDLRVDRLDGGPLSPGYANAGGTGDRTGVIRVTCSEDCLNLGNINDLIDGNTSAGTPQFANNDDPADHWIAFDFGAAVLITEARFEQDTTNDRTHGTWKWQGSNDYDTWTDIGAGFTLGGAPPQVQTSLSGNTTLYRWYRLRGVSGAMKPVPLYQFEFKIDGDLGDLGAEGAGDGLATTLLLEEGEGVPSGYYFTGEIIRSRKLVAKEIDLADILQAGDYWWDFSDSNVVTKDGSNNISRLADKGPSKNDLIVPTGATAPTHDVDIAGVTAADFSTGQYMTSEDNILDGEACEVFAALLPLNYTDTNRTLLQQEGASGQNRNFVLGRLLLGGAASGVVGFNTNKTYPILDKTICIHSWRIPGVGSQTVEMDYNGAEASETVTVTEGLTTNWNVGEQSFPGKPVGAYLGEIVVFNRALTASERARVRGYIERKWWNPTPVKKYHIVGAIGQSNMRGAYGPIDLSNVEDQPNKRIAMWGDESPQEGNILLAEHPLHHENINIKTIGMAMAYAKDLLATLPADEGVLIVGHAIPGSGLTDGAWKEWNKGDNGYEEFVAKMNAAVALGHDLHSVIWHQGETEAKHGTTNYETRLDQMISDMRTDITGATSLPFVLGTLGDFINTGTEAGNYPNVATVNSIINDTPNRVTATAVASATSLTDGGDDLHFDAASLRTFGGRYWTAFGTL